MTITPPVSESLADLNPPPARRGTDLQRVRRIAVIWVLLAAFCIAVYVLLALAIQSAYRAV